MFLSFQYQKDNLSCHQLMLHRLLLYNKLFNNFKYKNKIELLFNY